MLLLCYVARYSLTQITPLQELDLTFSQHRETRFPRFSRASSVRLQPSMTPCVPPEQADDIALI